MSPTHYRVISFDRQLMTGVTDTYQVSVSAVAKCNSPHVPYFVPNEHVCGELGRFLRLPIPPAALLYAPDLETKNWFASLDFNFTGNSLPPVLPERVAESLPDLATGIIVFDVLIGNCDRHAGNLAADSVYQPTRLFVFDQSHALFGYLSNGATARMTDLRDRLAISGGSRTGGNRHCLLSVLKTDSYFEKWIGRVESLPDYLVDELCGDSVDLGSTVGEAAAAAEFLKHRRGNMRTIIGAHRDAFTSIRQWSLFR